VDGFIDAGGVHTFYEVAGDAGGDPILFLHGGLVSGADYAAQRDGLAQQHTVILPDRRGHGRTPEVDGPISYDLMAQDTVDFMDALGLDRAHLAGHSDGGIIALLVAIAHPERVNRLVPIGANTSPDANQPEMMGWLAGATDEELAASVAEWGTTGPDWPTRSMAFFGRMRQMIVTEPHIAADDLARITAPTLIIGADRDLMSLEDLIFQFRGIPNAQLAIVPGVTHGLTGEQPDIVNNVILRFLAEG
jgi:pimeloyl-ACP methyl ester carboxylesterase